MKKSLKKVLIYDFPAILSQNFDENHYIIDDFRSEFGDLVLFLNKEENLLTKLEAKFRLFISTLSRKFPLKKDVFHLILVIIGLILSEETEVFQEKAGFLTRKKTLIKNAKNLMKINERFTALRRRLSHLNGLFIEKMVVLLMKWKELFED